MAADEDDDVFLERAYDERESTRTQVAVLNAKVRVLAWFLKHETVNRHEFQPVKLICYGLAGIVLSSVFVALIAVVLRKL